MIRIVIENLFVFLAPTLLYLVWMAFRRNTWPGIGSVLADAPLGKLFVTGAVLMLATLVAFSSRSKNAPGEAYVPPVVEGGTLKPGHAVPGAK
jgi:Family of unknown function (DUF6111)